MIRIITAIERDGFNIRVLTIPVDVENEEVDIVKSVKLACKEYVKTTEGEKVFNYNCECFNWADFEVNVPNSICEKYGFKKLESLCSDIEVDWDEQLV